MEGEGTYHKEDKKNTIKTRTKTQHKEKHTKLLNVRHMTPMCEVVFKATIDTSSHTINLRQTNVKCCRYALKTNTFTNRFKCIHTHCIA